MSISEQLEQVKEAICDKYCKYPQQAPPEGKGEDWLYSDDESPCIMCPLNQL